MEHLAVVRFLPWERILVCIQTNSRISYPPVKFVLLDKEDPNAKDDNIDEEEDSYPFIEEPEAGSLQIDPNADLDDYYALLGLKHRDCLANQKEISRAYRKISLKYHPDRVHDGDKTKAEERYKAIQKANDVLKDPISRRQYDSSREFDNSIPAADEYFASPEEMFEVYSSVFKRWSRWAVERPVPKFGHSETSHAHVESFYQSWEKFQSWRDFGYLGEFDLKDAENRNERRWMEQQNKTDAKAAKKEETQKIKTLVSRARKMDPRYAAILTRMREENDERNRARKEARRRAAAARDRMSLEKKAAEEKLKQAEAQSKRAEKEQREQRKKQIKQWKRWLKKSTNAGQPLEMYRARYELLVKDGTYDDWQKISALCVPDVTDDLIDENRKVFDEMHSDIEARVAEQQKIEQAEQLRKEEDARRREAAKKAREFWSGEELDLLVKAVQKYPGGTMYRWEKIRDALPNPNRTVEEVISKVKALAKQRRKGGKPTPPRPAPQRVADTTAVAGGESSSSPSAEKKKKKKKKKKDREGKEKKKRKKKEASDEDPNAWSVTQQQGLESALRQFKALPVNEKWESIANAVDGKTKKQCVERFKFIRAQLVAARKAQQTAV